MSFHRIYLSTWKEDITGETLTGFRKYVQDMSDNLSKELLDLSAMPIKTEAGDLAIVTQDVYIAKSIVALFNDGLWEDYSPHPVIFALAEIDLNDIGITIFTPSGKIGIIVSDAIKHVLFTYNNGTQHGREN